MAKTKLLKNSLIAGVLYISIIAILYGFTLTMFKTESDTFIPGDVEMQEMGSLLSKGSGITWRPDHSMGSLLAASTLSNTSSGSSWHTDGGSIAAMAGTPQRSIGTMSGATHTTATTAGDNIALSQMSGTIDKFGYPARDPRIDPIDTRFHWKKHWEPKHRWPWLVKLKRGQTPSIGSSGELDNISMHSRAPPSNQPPFKPPVTGDTLSTRGSMFAPALDDPRYYR